MSEKELVFKLTMQTPSAEEQEMVERSFLEFAARGGDEVKAEVIKGPTKWTLQAKFTKPELALQFAQAFPGGEEAIGREVERHEIHNRKEARDIREPDMVFVAVLFDRKRKVKEIIFHTDEVAATARGREIDAPVIIFVGLKHVGGIDTDLWIEGAVFLPDYGLPSKEIIARMKREGLKAVIKHGIERGRAAVAMAAKA
jgi:hypothetical protein